VVKMTKRSQLPGRTHDDLIPADRQQTGETRSSAPALRPLQAKQRSRRNAIRHGLTAETIIDALEDAEDYAAFELAVRSRL